MANNPSEIEEEPKRMSWSKLRVKKEPPKELTPVEKVVCIYSIKFPVVHFAYKCVVTREEKTMEKESNAKIRPLPTKRGC